MARRIIIVGGVAGGATAAARLRRLDEHADILVLERGPHISFANCGLPYHISGTIKDRRRLLLQTPESFRSRFNVDVRVRTEALKIDRANRTVTVRHPDGSLTEESYDALILSPGAEPILPPIPGVREKGVLVLRNIPDMDRILEVVSEEKTRSAVVVGGGYIGVEMAENLREAGLSVTIVELADHVIQSIDADMAADVHAHLVDHGIGLHLNTALTAITRAGGRLSLALSDESRLETDLVILSVGVRPETSLAREAGLRTGVRGCIVTDDTMRTDDPAIYAVGDAVEVTDFVTGQPTFIPLASPANRQGRIAADNLCGIPSRYRGTQGTAILKVFDMAVASTGASEKTLKEKGIPYGRTVTFSADHASYYPGATYMTLKTLFHQGTGKLLGAQITGYNGVDRRIDILAVAIRAGMTVEDLQHLELAYAPPFGSAKDPVNMAGFVAGNLLSGLDREFAWNEVAGLDLSRITLLDIRTSEEFENGSIPGAVNIPLDDLRQRIGELDPGKPVYLFCQIGLRGHVAARILSQRGFDPVYNLSGGYRFYRSNTRSFPALAAAPHARNEVSPILQDALDADLSEASIPQQERGESLPAVHAVDACGLQCPGPILRLAEAVRQAGIGDLVDILSTDPAFSCDVDAWARRTGHRVVEKAVEQGRSRVRILKEAPAGVETESRTPAGATTGRGKNLVVFSQDLDKAIAAFIIANGAAAMGRPVTMFFTFWGLNILRRRERVRVRKSLVESMFGWMMPRGSTRLGLSSMNMMGIGPRMIRGIMKRKNIDSLEDLVRTALGNGVRLVACTMSMDVMGIRPEELIDGVEQGGVASMLDFAEDSDMSMFI